MSRIVHTVSLGEIERGDHIYKYTTSPPNRDSARHGIFVGGATNDVISLVGTKVVRCKLFDEFLEGKQAKRYQYGVSAAEHAVKSKCLGKTSQCHSQPPTQVVEVATWFCDHPDLFSRHHTGVCTSEAFAVFCKTTSLNKHALNQARAGLGDLLRNEFDRLRSGGGGSRSPNDQSRDRRPSLTSTLVQTVTRHAVAPLPPATSGKAVGQSCGSSTSPTQLAAAGDGGRGSHGLSTAARAIIGGVAGGVTGGVLGATLAARANNEVGPT